MDVIVLGYPFVGFDLFYRRKNFSAKTASVSFARTGGTRASDYSSDLGNKFPEIEVIVNGRKPVYLTKNGYGTTVVLSLEEYASLIDSIEIKLDEADRQVAMTEGPLSYETVFSNVRRAINWK